MAKRAKAGDGEDPTSRTNGFDPSKVPNYIERIENLQDEIDGIMQEAKNKCAPLREDIASIKKEAAEQSNVPRRELNAKVTERRLRRKADAVRGTLSTEQQDNFDEMSKALGELKDTPLGRAALADAEGATAH